MCYKFKSKTGQIISVHKLSKTFAEKNCNEILNIINIIPHINWSKIELLDQSSDFYGNKWNFCYVIKNENNVIIGVLIAYFRISDEKHIFDSLYIHKFAIIPEYQNIGIGTSTLAFFFKEMFSNIPWLLNITVQTNDSTKNQYVIDFYKKLGFIKAYNIKYDDKIDILFLLERMTYVSSLNELLNSSSKYNLYHPHVNFTTDERNSNIVLPIIYFSSTNEKKKQIVKFIFNNYNIDVSFVTPPIELTEPQIEKPEKEEEKKLVSLPLKTISRFITNVPYVIEDTMLFVEYFNRNGDNWELPGLDTKRWFRQMGLNGFLDIMGNTNKRKAKFVSQTGAYVKSNTYYYGRGEITGTIAYEIPNISIVPTYGTYPYFFHKIFIPDGATKTLAEMDMYEYAKYDYMRKGIVQMIKELSNEAFHRELTLFDLL